MDFTTAVKREFNKTFTENGATAFKSTGASDILDLYAVVGGLRTRPESVVEKFRKACEEDLLLATRLMFYSRDIRGGLGERLVFRMMLRELANRNPSVVINNLDKVPFYGRWDDLFVLIETPVEKDMWKLLTSQLIADMEGYNAKEKISLLAKWLPSINSSSQKTIELANKCRKAFHLTARDYRKILSTLRAHLRVLETSMSKKAWSEIVYNQVPSRAMNIYRKAFYRNDKDRFSKYIEDVKSGTTTIKAGTLYPYDIVEKYSSVYVQRVDDVLEAQWKALPNYIEGDHNVIVMADVSGSMTGRPMATSIGLAVYFAERNSGPYKNLFMTFSGNPKFVKLEGDTLLSKIKHARRADWDMSTNLEGAFNEVLKVAVQNRVTSEGMPKAIVVISDMEINACASRSWSFYETMEKRFAQHGYTIPNIVFWNVNSRNDTFLVDGNRRGVQLVSGQSASTFKNVLASFDKTPYQAMLDVLNGARYESITL